MRIGILLGSTRTGRQSHKVARHLERELQKRSVATDLIDLADDNQQRSVMQSQFTMFWNHEKIHGITLWGYVSGQTWKANTGIMSSSGTPRPAMTWLLDFLEIP